MQMTREDILEKLKGIMVSMDPSKAGLVETVSDDTRLIEDLGYTSIAILYVVVAIEETFSICFGDLGVDDFKTIGDVLDYLDKSINK